VSASASDKSASADSQVRNGGIAFSDRLQHAAAQKGWNQTRLAEASGIPRARINDYWKGPKEPASNYLFPIAEALSVSAEWLALGGPFPTTPAPEPPPIVHTNLSDVADQLGLIKVEEIDLALGMGLTFLDEGAVQAVDRWIPVDWVRALTDAPANFLTIAKPVGDSMYPTINDRDIVLIDRSLRHIDRQDGIWALAYGGLGTIKRVRAMPDGSFKLMGDNPHVREETAHDGEMFVIGRVAGVIRRT